MQKESATPSVAHFRLLSDAMDELCAARNHTEVVCIGAALAHRTCGVESFSVLFASGGQFHFAAGGSAGTFSFSVRPKVVAHLSSCVLESAQTVVVVNSYEDERTRLHTNGLAHARSFVAVPVGGARPFAAVTFGWLQEHWPGASEVLVLEALARATGMALACKAHAVEIDEAEEGSSIAGWLDLAADAEGLRGNERRHWLAVAELQHRVRNVLGLIRSLVRRTCEASQSAQDYSAHLEGRIGALARAQAFQMRRPGVGVDLEELIDAELMAHAGRDARVTAGGPPIRLRAKSAETLGLAVHELATNAVKFGGLATPGGGITVTWQKEDHADGARVRLEWVESGVPLGAAQPTHRGFGRELIERIVPYELRGAARLMFEPGGVRCVIHMPLTRDNVIAEPMAIA